MRKQTLALLALAAAACHGSAASSSDSRPVPASASTPMSSSTRITAAAASGELLPLDYVERITIPVRLLVDSVERDSSWDRHIFFTVRRNGAVRFDREVPASDSVGAAVAERIARAGAAGAFTPLPLGWDDSLSFDLHIIHPPSGLPAPDTSGAYFAFQVTRPVVVLHDEPPAYPPALQRAGVDGRVIVRFIVGTNGRAEPASFHVLQSPRADLTAAARAAVLASTYRPAELRGRKVRQVVTQPFDFVVR